MSYDLIRQGAGDRRAVTEGGEVSASQADIVDAKGNWIGTVRKDFDEDSEDKPLIVELRNMLPELLEAFAQTKPPSTAEIAEIAEIEKWSRWSLQPGIATDDQTLKNAIGYVAALLSVVHRQGYQLQCADKAQENIKSIHDLAVVRKEEAEEREDKALAGLAAADEKIEQLRADLARSIAVTDEKIAEGEQWRDKWRKASAETVADRMEIERLQNALEAAERKLADLGSELTIAGTMIVRVREEANQQRARAETAEAALSENKCWQFEQPTPGRWRMKFLRGCGYEIMECEVTPFQTESSDLIVILPGQWANSSLPINDEFFINAQWQRVE